jgi:etoposide-induced 2.4 mRNA
MVSIVSDEIYRSILFLSYLVITALVYFVPKVGAFVSFILMCWIYAYYSFEYGWIHKGWTVDQRIAYFERHWAYFLGFGTLLCME